MKKLLTITCCVALFAACGAEEKEEEKTKKVDMEAKYAELSEKVDAYCECDKANMADLETMDTEACKEEMQMCKDMHDAIDDLIREQKEYVDIEEEYKKLDAVFDRVWKCGKEE